MCVGGGGHMWVGVHVCECVHVLNCIKCVCFTFSASVCVFLHVTNVYICRLSEALQALYKIKHHKLLSY